MPVLPGPAVPVDVCSRMHLARSSPVRLSQRPVLGPAAPAPLTAPLVPTLLSEKRGLVPWVPAVSPLVPVDGRVSRAALPPGLPVPGPWTGLPLFWMPMLEPVWGACANAADDNAKTAAAVAVSKKCGFMQLLSKQIGKKFPRLYANGVPP